MIPSLSTHPLVSSIQKKNLQGVGGVFLTKGKWELGLVHRLIFWKHKNIKTHLSHPKNPEKYSTPSTGTK
jgi:hypothetical protein